MRHVYFRQMKRYLDKHPKARVFVATDSVQFLEEAKAAFGDAVCALEATRLETADEIKGLHFSDHAKSKGALLGEVFSMPSFSRRRISSSTAFRAYPTPPCFLIRG